MYITQPRTKTGEGSRLFDLPLEGSEGIASSSGLAPVEYRRAVAVAQIRCKGDETCEPEDHGDGLDGQNGEVVMRCWQHHRREDEICQGEPCPDGAEDSERDRRGGCVDEEVVPVAGS